MPQATPRFLRTHLGTAPAWDRTGSSLPNARWVKEAGPRMARMNADGTGLRHGIRPRDESRCTPTNGRSGSPPVLGWRQERIHRRERRDRRVPQNEADVPCDGSAFTAPLRFTLLEGANESLPRMNADAEATGAFAIMGLYPCSPRDPRSELGRGGKRTGGRVKMHPGAVAPGMPFASRGDGGQGADQGRP